LIDIHCHLLPRIDDGSKDWEESLELCEKGFRNGLEEIILTPHLMDFSKADHLIEKRDQLTEKLIEKLKMSEEASALKLYKGFEVFASEEILTTSELKKLTLNGTKYILVEFNPSLKYVSFVIDSLEAVERQGLTMIMAHVERYQFTQKDHEFVNYLLDKGVLFQVNADSILGDWGQKAQRLAVDMLDQNMVHFMASDAHNTMRNNNMNVTLKEISRFITDLQITDIVETNAKSILADGMLNDIQRGMLR